MLIATKKKADTAIPLASNWTCIAKDTPLLQQLKYLYFPYKCNTIKL